MVIIQSFNHMSYRRPFITTRANSKTPKGYLTLVIQKRDICYQNCLVCNCLSFISFLLRSVGILTAHFILFILGIFSRQHKPHLGDS